MNRYFLSLEMETGVMDGWNSEKKACEQMIEYFKDLFPDSRWIIVQRVLESWNSISNELFFARGGQRRMIERYGEPRKID